jgi:hypothetical protein
VCRPGVSRGRHNSGRFLELLQNRRLSNRPRRCSNSCRRQTNGLSLKKHTELCGRSAAAYVRNMLNRQYAVGGLGLGAIVGVDSVVLGTPRMAAVEDGLKF